MCKCKKCQSSEYTKAGFVKGEQRYKCKKCGCQFVPTRHKGRSEEEKREAVKLYSHGLSFRAIAKLLKVSAQSVFVWVKNFAENNYAKPTPTDEGVVIELDEMWHFLHLHLGLPFLCSPFFTTSSLPQCIHFILMSAIFLSPFLIILLFIFSRTLL